MSQTRTIHKAEALYSLEPAAVFTTEGTTVVWISEDISQPTEAEITAEISRLQAEYDANAYARSRKAAYDALNQLELISDDAINGTTTYADAILAIKAEFPKPV